MATISELLPYLRQGYTLQSVRGEVIRPLSVESCEWLKARGYRFESEKYSLAQMSSQSDMWSWGVLFTSDGKNVFLLDSVAGIEEAIARGIKGAAYAAPAE